LHLSLGYPMVYAEWAEESTGETHGLRPHMVNWSLMAGKEVRLMRDRVEAD
jgi:hypothetical protein